MYRKEQKDEYYTRLAHEEGYPARSVYKLKEIDERFKLISPEKKILDLGSAPGSWLAYISEKIGKDGRVVGVDTTEVDVQALNRGKKSNITFLKRDVLSLTAEDMAAIGSPFDLVVADLGPKTTGVVEVDAGKSLELNQMAFEIAQKVLKNGGVFLSKIFDGEDVNDFIKELEKHFEQVKRVKPKAVIKKSREFYILGLNYKSEQGN